MTPIFKNISLSSGKGIVEDAGTLLDVQSGGSISLTANNVTINGTLTARGGAHQR